MTLMRRKKYIMLKLKVICRVFIRKEMTSKNKNLGFWL